MIVVGLQGSSKKSLAIDGKPPDKLLSPPAMLLMLSRIQKPLEPIALEITQQRFTGIATSEVLKPRQITVLLIRRITEHSPNVSQLLDGIFGGVCRFGEISMAANRRQITQFISRLGNASYVVEVMTSKLARRMIDYEEICQTASPTGKPNFRSEPSVILGLN